jgi:phosphoribosylformimino-5-aminoimidazole carboxamide ribotide isomerase
MIIFPAIDLKNGQCVRLTQGDFTTATIYESNPVKQAETFAAAGATWLHMVDLDGAKAGEMLQADVMLNVAKTAKMKIQVGGGIRSAKTIERLLGAGIARVVIGSLAVKNRGLVKEWLRTFGPQHFVLAFDIRFQHGEPEILTQGWQSGSQQVLWDVLDAYDGSGLQTILCTDVSRDGMLAGVNNELYQAIQKRVPHIDVIASGGVSNLEDVIELKQNGLHGVVVGKAIYEGRLDLAEALKRFGDAG